MKTHKNPITVEMAGNSQFWERGTLSMNFVCEFRGRGRLGAPLLLHTHNTHCTLKLSLVSGICSQRGAGGVGVGDWLQVSMEMIGREGPEQVVGAKAGTALTAKLECPDGTRYYFDIQSNM